MYSELDHLLKQDVTADSWYDDGFLMALDILEKFSDEDWKKLCEEVLTKDLEWQKKLVYCLDDQLKEEELIVISKLLCVNDRELFEMCLDSLRSFDNEFGHSFVKNNPQIIQIAKARVKEMGVVGKVILEKFISTFDKKDE